MAKLIKRNGKYYIRRFSFPWGFEYLGRNGRYWWSDGAYAERYAPHTTEEEAEKTWENSRTEVIKKLK